MRRPRSSSCLLLPKESIHEDDPRTELSVTLISKERLPSYSVERFFMISEMESQAASIHFLSDLMRNNDESTIDTIDTACSSGTVQEGERLNGEGNEPQPQHLLPKFVLLYILWRPEMTACAEVFTETFLMDAVKRLKEVTCIADVRTGGLSRSRFPASSGSDGPTKGSASEATAAGNSGIDTGDSKSDGDLHDTIYQEMPANSTIDVGVTPTSPGRSSSSSSSSNLYLIVDRVAVFEKQNQLSSHHHAIKEETNDAEIHHHEEQLQLVELLARRVASHSVLRNICEGITVGVSNHVRAAPALEACLNAVSVGAKDRRKEGPPGGNKSCIGLIADQPADLLGLQSDQVTDAAQGVLQTRICAEWNGLGNLQTFANRAHAAWRKQHGLPDQPQPSPVVNRRRVPKRRSRGGTARRKKKHLVDEAAIDQAMKEHIYDGFVLILFAFYVMFHFDKEVRYLLWLLTKEGMEDLVQYLREL